jgi:L-glutamine-phosphate cytidylyltransferase
MKVIILCAGMGTRLRPYTDSKPKCLVEFFGYSLLDWQLASLNSCGLQDITLLGGYKSALLEKFEQRIVLNERFSETNMLYSLLQARDVILSGEDIIVSYGDIIYEPRIIESLLTNSNDLVVAADLGWRNLWSKRFSDPLDDAETFIMDDEGTLVEIGDRPKGYEQIEGQYRGLTKISADYAERLLDLCEMYKADYSELDFESLSMTELLMYLITKGEVVDIAATNGGWLEFDNVTDLELYTKLQEQGELKSLFDANSIGLTA